MKTQVLIKFLNAYSPKKIAIVGHRNADPDAVCSMYAFSHFLKKLYSDIEISLIAEDINKVSEQIITKLNFDIEASLPFKPDIIILIDANNLIQIGKIKDFIPKNIPIIIIDHHIPHPETNKISQFKIIDENATSTSEIIYKIFKEIDLEIEPKIALSLLMGILYDTRRFTLISNETFAVVIDLLRAGANYGKALELLRTTMDKSEKIARLKAAQRATLHKVRDWIIVTSHVSTYEASACRAFIDLGADVAFVVAEKDNEVRISARAAQEFYEKTSINLAKIMEKVGKVIGGVGGGHATAAGANGIKNGEEGLKEALKILKEEISKLP